MIQAQKRKKISLKLKLEILRRFEKGEKSADIGRILDIPASTIRNICNRDANKIKQFAKTATPFQSNQVTKSRSALMVKMESLLIIWIEKQKQRNMPLTKAVIQKKAQSLFYDLQKCSTSSATEKFEKLEKFEASQGWFERFKTRINLPSIALKSDDSFLSFEGMATKDIYNQIQSHNEDLTNEDLIKLNLECAMGETDIKTTKRRELSVENISKVIHLVTKAIDFLKKADPDEKRSSKVARNLKKTIKCYEQIYIESIKKRKDLETKK